MKSFITLSAIITLVFLFTPFAAALTVEEVLQLRKAGVSDETIQLMIEQEMLRETLADPARNMGVRRLKEADGRSSTIYSTGQAFDPQEGGEASEWEKREKAWEMLDNVIIDARESEKCGDGTGRKKER